MTGRRTPAPVGAESAPIRTWVSWSSGKDAAWTLHVLRADPTYSVVGALTAVTETFDRVSMHGVRTQLLDRQLAMVGLEPHPVRIPFPCPNPVYEAAMGRALDEARVRGVTAIAFGDLFLEDVRRYRAERLRGTGVDPVFPLWGRDTRRLAREMIGSGLRARIVCVDPKRLDPRFAGREFDARFLADLPEGVDPCGERGEFHTFVYDGPGFRAPIHVVDGEVVERDGFVFADLLPAD